MSDYFVEIGDKLDKLINKRENCLVVKRLGAEVISYRVWDEDNQRILPLLWNDNNDFPSPQGDGKTMPRFFSLMWENSKIRKAGSMI